MRLFLLLTPFFISFPLLGAFLQSFHYKSTLVGDRSAGMGGAYTAVSDDPAGCYYNPAGLVFAQGNDISASVNAYTSTNIVYKDILGTVRKQNPDSLTANYRNKAVNFTESTSDYFPPFVGGIQTLGNMKLGFSVVTETNITMDQNDNFSKVSDIEQNINTLYRTFQLKENYTLAGPSIAFQPKSWYSLGFTLYGYNRKMIFSDFQLIVFNADKEFKQPGAKSQNLYLNINNMGVMPVFGFQMMWKKLSFGIAVRKGINISDENKSVQSTHLTLNGTEYNTHKTDSEKAGADYSYVYSLNNDKPLQNIEEDNPIQINTGIAYYATSRFLFTMDHYYYGGSKAQGDPQKTHDNTREMVNNWAVGTEYYLTPNLPLRLGAFSNYSFAPAISKKKEGQVDHLDFIGGSFSASWSTKESTISLGGIMQMGSGESQKVGDSSIQEIEALSYTIFFAGSYSI